MARYLTECSKHGIVDSREYGCSLCEVSRLQEVNQHLQLLIKSAYYELKEHDGDYHYKSSGELLDEMSKWIGD